MARQKVGSEDIRKLTKVGGATLAVTIPVEIVRKLKLREKQRVTVTEKGGVITIKDWKSKK